MYKPTDLDIKISSSAARNNKDYGRGELQNCELCLGDYGKSSTRPCKYCGVLLNWLNGKPIEYASGTIHHCPALRSRDRFR